jgi:hypothetical protein
MKTLTILTGCAQIRRELLRPLPAGSLTVEQIR